MEQDQSVDEAAAGVWVAIEAEVGWGDHSPQDRLEIVSARIAERRRLIYPVSLVAK
jgi:hypothetical protein